MASWDDAIKNNQQYHDHGFKEDDVYEIEGSELIRLRRIQLRLYYDMDRLDSNMMRDMAHLLGIAIGRVQKTNWKYSNDTVNHLTDEDVPF